MVTVPALQPYLDELMRGIGHSELLLRPGQDAHSFTLSPSQREKLDKAEIILVADRKMSVMLEKLLATEEKRGAKVIALTSFPEAQTLPYAPNPWAEEGDDEEGQPGDPDPHLWLDPVRMADLALPLADAIAKASPANRAQLEANAKTLSEHLKKVVDPALRKMIEGAPRHRSMSARKMVPFITYHAAYQYFMKRYGLDNGGEIIQRPEDYMGAKTLHTAVKHAETYAIRCVITESDAPLVRRIATASEARIVILSPEATYTSEDVVPLDWPQNDYDRLLLKTAQSFADCL